jgi:hypothetical protein
MKRFVRAAVFGFSGLLALSAFLVLNPFGVRAGSSAHADNLSAKPWIFVGNVGDCGGTAGSNIVTSAWLGGIGLSDSSGNARDPHRGLLLSKNGLTSDCSSAGATINGVRGMTVSASFTLGFDYRDGGHCGGGAPRFNVTYDPPTGPRTSSFVGNCATGTQVPAVQDPQWITERFGAASQFPPIPAGSHIRSIDIVFDEGTDQAGTSDPNGIGLATIDNIFINGQTIGNGVGVAEPNGPRGDKHDKNHGGDDNDD